MLDGALFLPYISKFGRVSYCMYLFCVVSYSFENYLASTYVHDLLSFVCSMELLSYSKCTPLHESILDFLPFCH